MTAVAHDTQQDRFAGIFGEKRGRHLLQLDTVVALYALDGQLDDTVVSRENERTAVVLAALRAKMREGKEQEVLDHLHDGCLQMRRMVTLQGWLRPHPGKNATKAIDLIVARRAEWMREAIINDSRILALLGALELLQDGQVPLRVAQDIRRRATKDMRNEHITPALFRDERVTVEMVDDWCLEAVIVRADEVVGEHFYRNRYDALALIFADDQDWLELCARGRGNPASLLSRPDCQTIAWNVRVGRDVRDVITERIDKRLKQKGL